MKNRVIPLLQYMKTSRTILPIPVIPYKRRREAILGSMPYPYSSVNIFNLKNYQSGMLTHIFKKIFWNSRAVRSIEFQASQGYTVRLTLIHKTTSEIKTNEKKCH